MTARIRRRQVLKGLGGVALALPFLEGLAARNAHAQAAAAERRFAIFFRQANGVAQASGGEPERFWPRDFGALTTASMQGRAVEELQGHAARLLVLQNVNYGNFDFGDGHAAGCMQALTARPPLVAGAGGDSEAGGESIDHRIGRELNPDGRESLVMFCGQTGGWLNGPSISHRAAGQRRTALHDPFAAYQTLVGASAADGALQEQIAVRGRSVNDLVRAQLTRLKAHPRLSLRDRDRLELHLQAVRDIEVSLTVRFNQDREAALQGAAPGFDSTDGDQVLETARLHMDIAALAVSAGLTRAVSIQVGVGNDGNTRYHRPDGSLMENYHFISHRQLSHGSDGAPIPNADVLHHEVDRQFAVTFRHLLDELSTYPGVAGGTLLDEGVAIWYNDNGTGPPHSVTNVPWILAGSCGGFFRQGEQLDVAGGAGGNTHRRLLNTIGTAVGCTDGAGGPLVDFGDPSLPGGLLDDVLA